MAGTELIRDFVNTRDLLDGIEELATPAALAIWLGVHALGEVEATPGISSVLSSYARRLDACCS